MPGGGWRADGYGRGAAGFVTTAERDWDLPTGAKAQTYDRSLGASSNSDLLSGRLTLVAVHLRAGQVISSITFFAASTALSGGSNQWFALYDSALGKLAVTADDTTTAWGGNSFKTLALTAPYTVLTSGLYYLGICVVATTVPTLRGPVTVANLNAAAPVLAGSSTTGLTDPASAPTTAAAITATVSTPYAYCS